MRFYKVIRENQFFLKMLLTYCLVIFLGLGLTSYFVSTNMIGILTEVESRFDHEVIQKIKSYSDDRYRIVKSIFARLYQKQYFNDNTSIVEFINPAKEGQRNNSSKLSVISSYLQDTCSANPFVTDIFIIDYGDRDVFFFSNVPSRDVSVDYDFFELDLLRENVSNTIEMIPNHIPEYIISPSDNGFPVITYCIYLFDENAVKFDRPLGMAVINIRADFFRAAYKDSSSLKGTLFVIANRELTLFDSDSSLSGQPFPFAAYAAAGLPDLVSGGEYIVNKLHSEETGFTFVHIVNKQVIEKETEGIRRSIHNIIAVCVVLTLLISLISASAFAKRIKSLVRNMKAVENGKFDTRIQVSAKDEIGYLEQSFHTMCVKLEAYIRDVYVFQIKSKTAELKALQAQINPHFLFNTLESIRITAQLNHDIQAAKMTHILGNMFRWNIKTKGMFTDLKEEMGYIHSYIELQALRYDHSFGFSTDIEPAAQKLGVPKLILQPMVENAINHGLSMKMQDGYIAIKGFLVDGNLALEVADNGKGMDERRIAEVVAGLDKDQNEMDLYNIGLCNVHQRISILFGEGYGLKISSEIGKGTVISILIPALSKEEMERYVQGSHR